MTLVYSGAANYFLSDSNNIRSEGPGAKPNFVFSLDFQGGEVFRSLLGKNPILKTYSIN